MPKDKTEEAKKERDAKIKEELKKLDAKYKHQHIVAMVSKQGTEEVTLQYSWASHWVLHLISYPGYSYQGVSYAI